MIKYCIDRIFKQRKSSFGFIIACLFVFYSCESNLAQKSTERDSLLSSDTVHFNASLIDTLKLGLNFSPKTSYSDCKRIAKENRMYFHKAFLAAKDSAEKNSIIDSAGIFFTNHLLNEIVPHWYGTKWDFNGYTEKPNNGVIACGYFVSTTLKHMGLNINRYKFAQQYGLLEAKTLQAEESLLILNTEYNSDFESINNYLDGNLADGLYFVGLSNHVGYIYVKDEIVYFLHSNYIDGYVMIEKSRFSDAFRSQIYVIAEITNNEELIKNWLSNTFIPVIEK